MRRTHEAWAPVPWLVGTGAVDAASVLAGHPPLVQLVVVVLGVPLTRPFSAGRNSPDVDFLWAPGRPRDSYNWRYHRGFTHRVWFASLVISPLWVALAIWIWNLDPFWGPVLAPLALAAPAGWWSHLTGDMWFGRLPVWFGRRRLVGLGRETGGPDEIGLAAKLRRWTVFFVFIHCCIFVWAVLRGVYQ